MKNSFTCNKSLCSDTEIHKNLTTFVKKFIKIELPFRCERALAGPLGAFLRSMSFSDILLFHFYQESRGTSFSLSIKQSHQTFSKKESKQLQFVNHISSTRLTDYFGDYSTPLSPFLTKSYRSKNIFNELGKRKEILTHPLN